MSKIIAGILIVAAGSVAYVGERAVDRQERMETQGKFEAAKTRAERAEQRAEAYRRALPANTLQAVEGPGAGATPDPFADVPMPFESNVAELRDLLGLTDEQTAQLRGLYEQQWERTKEGARSGKVSAEAAHQSFEDQARRFLSAEQSLKLTEYVQKKQAGGGRKAAEAQAEQMRAALGLDDDQVPRVADALFALYSAPAGSVGSGAAVDMVSDALRPVLTQSQMERFVALMGQRKPSSVTN